MSQALGQNLNCFFRLVLFVIAFWTNLTFIIIDILYKTNCCFILSLCWDILFWLPISVTCFTQLPAPFPRIQLACFFQIFKINLFGYLMIIPIIWSTSMTFQSCPIILQVIDILFSVKKILVTLLLHYCWLFNFDHKILITDCRYISRESMNFIF